MLKTLKARGLSAGVVIISIILVIAFKGQNMLHDNLQNSQLSNIQLSELSQLVNSIKSPIVGIESSLFHFLLSLEDSDKEPVRQNIKLLQQRVPLLDKAPLITGSPKLQKSLHKVKQKQQALALHVEENLNLSTRQRFPSMKLMFEKLNPSINRFNIYIQVIENLLNQPDTSIPITETSNLVNRLKYAWSHSVSNTRLMISSRTGIFGNPEAAMQYLDRNVDEYNKQLSQIFVELDSIIRSNHNDLEFNDALENLSGALKTRIETINLLRSSLSLNNWRRDKYIMFNSIDPLISEIQYELDLIQQFVSEQSKQNLYNSQYASEQLSNFLWIITFVMIAMILSTYLIFEFWIRIPLQKVATAMNSEASQLEALPVRPVHALEIDLVIVAFEKMQRQVRRRQQRLTSILRKAGEGIVVLNSNNNIDSFNQAAERIFGLTTEQVMNKKFTFLFDDQQQQQLDFILSDLKYSEHNSHQYICSGRHKDGSVFPIDLTVSNMRLDEDIFHILVIRDASERIESESILKKARNDAEQMQQKLADQVQQLDTSITQLKLTQQQLVESKKMESLAGLVAGVAHEINTPVGVGVTASSHLQAELESIENKHKNATLTSDDLEEYLEDATTATRIIQNNLHQAATLIRSFKQVAVDQNTEELRTINLKQYLMEIILNLHPKLKKTQHHIEINVADKINLTTIPGALSQIMTNLILNSLLHAYDKDDKGTIIIETEQLDDEIELTYQDDGKGILESDRQRIFDPFFTTRRGSGGSGLGLHVTYNLVTSSLKGSIECQSDVDKGARFLIKLPLTQSVES